MIALWYPTWNCGCHQCIDHCTTLKSFFWDIAALLYNQWYTKSLNKLWSQQMYRTTCAPHVLSSDLHYLWYATCCLGVGACSRLHYSKCKLLMPLRQMTLINNILSWITSKCCSIIHEVAAHDQQQICWTNQHVQVLVLYTHKAKFTQCLVQ